MRQQLYMKTKYYPRKILTYLLSLTLIYITLLIALGYQYGFSDQIEVLPYWQSLFTPEGWSGDFFVSHQLDRTPNERYLFVQLLSLTGPPHPVTVFILHFLTTMLLLWGLDRVTRIWIKTPYVRAGVLFATALLLYGINTGGNELYYPILTNSYVAQVIGIHAIYYWLRQKVYPTTLLLIAAGLMHILIGVQLFCLIMGATAIEAIRHKTLPSILRVNALPLVLWLVTVGTLLVLLFIQVNEGYIDPALQFEIMEFRLAHHFFPGYFPLKSWLVVGGLAAASLIAFQHRSQKLLHFAALTIIGCIIYTIGVYPLSSTAILSSQWFEATIWLEFVGLLGLAIFYVKKIQLPIADKLSLPVISAVACALVALLAWSSVPVFDSKVVSSPVGNEPDAQIDLARQAAALTDSTALFLLPPEMTAFKWYAKRASYVDYKAMIHHKAVMSEWYQRVQWAYGLDIESRRNGEDMYQIAGMHMAGLLKNDQGGLADRGITHVVLHATYQLDRPAMYVNDQWVLYRLD
jgi:hypothetical protein